MTEKVATLKDPVIASGLHWQLAILSCIEVVIEYAETMLFPAISNIINDFKINYDTLLGFFLAV